jgi:DNA repair exonuclease SbcCD ATPase subunit
MIGKNGVSKLVLSSVIPIINYELIRLLDEVCDFEVELEINDKNEVDFNIIKNNITKKLKSGSGLETTLSSLALRCVLGRISTLPKPNIIVFDEVLGKVANINLDYVKIFFDKIKKMYEIILLITHNPITQDWADKIITIEKNNDISTLEIK